MADLGDLREGIIDKDELVRTAKFIEEKLDHVHLAGIGTNLGCVGAVVPTKEKMEMLCEWAEAVEDAISRPLEIVSGGASSSLMPVIDGVMPSKINNLRIGALVICGPLEDYRTCYGREEADVLSDEVFILEAEVIESGIKPTHPIGELGVNAFGERAVYDDRGDRKRVLLAIGRADYGDIGALVPMLEGAEVTMASSDHTVMDVEDCDADLKVGDKVKFKLRYSAILSLTASENVHKENINTLR
jgi:predicted amino acid racemase